MVEIWCRFGVVVLSVVLTVWVGGVHSFSLQHVKPKRPIHIIHSAHFTHSSLTSSIRRALAFGDKIDFSFPLPTKDSRMVDRFLQSPEFVLERIWDKNKVKKCGPNAYTIQLMIVPIRGVDIIAPEIKLHVDSESGVVYLNSDQLILKSGRDGAFKNPSTEITDIRFTLHGELKSISPISRSTMSSKTDKKFKSVLNSSGGAQQVTIRGNVEYKVNIGQIPCTLSSTPATATTASTDASTGSTIPFAPVIVNSVEYVKKETKLFLVDRMAAKLTKAYKAYARQLLLQYEDHEEF